MDLIKLWKCLRSSVALTLLLFTSLARAQVFGPSATEVRFNYTTSFVTSDDESSAEEVAALHVQHLYGVMTTPELTRHFGLNPEKVGGIGVPRSDWRVFVKNDSINNNRREIRYSVSGKVLMHKRVAKHLLESGELRLPLPAEIDNFYDRNCTDAHYNSLGDFWYFWNPYRKGCEYLGRAPFAQQVAIRINSTSQPDTSVKARLDLLRGDNRNGSEFLIYAVHGFSESSKKESDEGPEHIFELPLALPDGTEILVRVRSLLIDTSLESKSSAFAKSFKAAVEEADVIFYAGHSGLGGNLDIPSLEEKAGEFQIDPKKRQLFFFDSCSSYSYFLEPFRSTKTKSKIDILTNGLASYFHTSPATTRALFDVLLDETILDQSWQSIMKSMEKPLEGGSYLLNVGGI